MDIDIDSEKLDLDQNTNQQPEPGPLGDEDLVWYEGLTTVADKLNDFTSYWGPIHDYLEDSAPLVYFKLFIPYEISDLMVEQTNLYAQSEMKRVGKDDPYWKLVTHQEIFNYIREFQPCAPAW